MQKALILDLAACVLLLTAVTSLLIVHVRDWTIRKMSKKKEDEILEDLESAPEPIYGEDLGTKTVSKLLVEARQSLNLSQKEIADQLYLTKTLIQQLEEGEFEIKNNVLEFKKDVFAEITDRQLFVSP